MAFERRTEGDGDERDRARAVLDFDELYRIYAPPVGRLVRRYIRDRDRAEDLVQETFLRAWAALERCDQTRPMWPWLATMAKRLVIDEWRASASPCGAYLESDGGPVAVPSSDNDPVEAYWALERREVVRRTLAAIAPRHRRMLMLKDHEGWEYEELAALEGTTAQAIRNTMSRARHSFRHAYESLARERGLNGAVWPILVPVVARLRGLARRAERSALWMRSAAANGAADLAGSAGAMHLSGALMAVAVVLSSAIVPAPASPGRLHELDLAASSVRWVGGPNGDAASNGYRSETRWWGGGTVGGGSGDPTNGGTHEDPDTLWKPDVPTAPMDGVAPVEKDDVTDPNRNVSEPEDAQMTSIVYSPRNDGTVLAAGRNKECATQVGCPAVLYRSADGGASWSRLNAKDFDGKALVLPPAYGSGDDRIFAMTPSGVLQVSADEGESFGPAVTTSPQGGGPMTISPDFNAGDRRILIGTQSSLMKYEDDTKSITPAAYSSLPGSLDPVFATPDMVIVGGRQTDTNGHWGSAVYRCGGTICEGTRLSDEAMPLMIRLSPGFAESGRVYAFSERALYISDDGARSFQERPVPTLGGALRDLAEGDEQRVFAAVWSAAALGDEGLYVSTAGSPWERVAHPLFAEGVREVQASGSRVLAALGNGGVACSADGGVTWGPRC